LVVAELVAELPGKHWVDGAEFVGEVVGVMVQRDELGVYLQS